MAIFCYDSVGGREVSIGNGLQILSIDSLIRRAYEASGLSRCTIPAATIETSISCSCTDFARAIDTCFFTICCLCYSVGKNIVFGEHGSCKFNTTRYMRKKCSGYWKINTPPENHNGRPIIKTHNTFSELERCRVE